VAVDHHQMRLARCLDQPHVQLRVVLEHRADAGQHRAGPGAPGVAVGARGLRGDPLAHAVVKAGLAVERSGNLHAYPGALADHAAEEADVELARGGGAGANLDLHARGPQALEALAGDQRVRVGQRGDDAAHARRDQRIAARAGAPVVRAGLERDVGRRALDRAALRSGVAQRHHLGVRTAGLLRVALAEHTAFGIAQHAAHARVRVGQQQRRRGQAQRGRDVQGVLFGEGHGLGGRS
jgi:hypothetical protein